MASGEISRAVRWVPCGIVLRRSRHPGSRTQPSLRAKRSNPGRLGGGDLDGFVAEPVIGPRVRADPLAPCNDVRPHPRGTICPSFAGTSALEKLRARGMPGALAPAVSCATKLRERTRVDHRYTEQSGIPRAMFDDLLSALLGVPGFVITDARTPCRAKGRHRHLASLIPASGCQDHMASSNASRALRRCAQIASIASPPHVS